MNPNTVEEWIDIANERSSDAMALIEKRLDSVGSVYMAGYAIECCLKAYLKKKKKPFPMKGKEGHNLSGLWKSAGFSLGDLCDTAGEKTYFITSWNTDLRYAQRLDSTLSKEDLLKGAMSIVGIIKNQIRRNRRTQ